ncbi:long-chain fatty acid--CoA ligase [Ruegeria pomeroyi]|uniref:Long-chain fatty acid--CoA ligase n=1 Tax=Ruegeria alba TaxID=2916756 RepID=A0ABS9NRT2_9RHOB|nr:long-chain fatty acid--CoA ligase [Ruegeria alba]MCE8517171.1 long-chain fatty acid--CoA ligase [Ruegeria pomeroyi]MCE8519895.1 long-chain fatty acid--CoA ligase [Ruegeria pomeroyi]MCE8527866.1 long-chain fatty acid--CoA ligase [Ruegeria pomeroyi]MCE8532291.1 long-chain fatty acid--CoA ligase [Ruegeria pomeroyi]MCE8554579.1 long-chain fatty acid--CoA ligase [Ruegeria pomeroyi]
MDTRTLPAQTVINGVTFNATPGQRPVLVDGTTTISALFQKRCAELGTRTAHREKDFGIWKSYSWADYWQHAKWIGLALRKLGLKRGEVVSILSEDRKEWAWFDMGIQAVGGIASGVYTTDSASQLKYLINDSDSRFLIAENEEQLDKYLQIEGEVPGLLNVIILEDEGLHDLNHPRCLMIDKLYEIGREAEKEEPGAFEAEIALTRPEDVALLIYTSGTTGMPKGAMLTHENIMAGIEAGAHRLPTEETDEQLCFLPLCHILERDVSIYFPLASKCTVNFAESPETVFANLQEVSPATFTAVPRVWEKIYSQVLILAQEATPSGRAAFGMALRAGMKRAQYLIENKPVPAGVAANFWLWDRLVLRNLRRMLGMDKMRRGGTGAAPISPELLKWYWAIGVPLVEGYGMTETAGIATINTPEENRIGTIGKVVPGIEVRIAEGGEIQVKGLNIFKGYWRNNEKTAESFTDDGWLRTGDIGRMDGDGYVTITGRLKDIIITAGGKNITPAEIESRLKFSHYISDAVIVGDKRKFLTCLIMIDQENVEKFAQDRKVPFSNFASLCAAKEVRELIAAEVAQVNKEFARVEQIKDFRLIDVLLTAEDDELTATMKLKRSFVEKKHAHLIEDMYK